MVFLPRHGRGHRLSPSDINYRANIDALKRAGVTDLVSLSACGSFKEELAPGHFVLVDQFIDRTRRSAKRASSARAAWRTSRWRIRSGRGCRRASRRPPAAEGIAYTRGGTYVCMEGPQFSSYAESTIYKGMGIDVIGMTNMPEAKLAREAEITYATVAMVTDYDCWHEEHDAVDVASIIKVLNDNADKARRLVARLARDFPAEHEPCPVGSDTALDFAMITAPEARDPALLQEARRGGRARARQSLITSVAIPKFA